MAFGVDGFKALELILLYGRSGKRAGLLEPAFGLALVVLIQRAVGEMQVGVEYFPGLAERTSVVVMHFRVLREPAEDLLIVFVDGSRA